MNNKEKNIVPQLRFPEFVEDVEWNIDKFSSFIKLYRGSSPRPISQFLTKDENGVNWIKIGDTKNAVGFKISKVEEKITTEGSKKSRKVKKGELILANSMSYGATYELKIEGCIYDGWFVLREYEDSFDKQFLLQLLNSDFLQIQYKRLAAGGIVQNISSEIVYNTLLPKFSIKEQQKIAACLSSLDEVINAETEKLELLQDHKKGLLQHLFPQEGETQPKYRFPEFKNGGDWKEVALGDLVEIKGRIGYRGYTVKDIVKKGEGAITLSPSNFDDNGKLNFDKSTYISWDKYNESPEIMLEEGQTVLVKTASVGKSAYVENLPEKTTVNPQIVVLKPKKIQPKFLSYTIFHNYVQNQIRNTVGAGAIPNMSQASISKLKILLPPSKGEKEQQKIADCLSSVDNLIEAQSQKIEDLENHKKGLLQQLFPNINDVVV